MEIHLSFPVRDLPTDTQILPPKSQHTGTNDENGILRVTLGTSSLLLEASVICLHLVPLIPHWNSLGLLEIVFDWLIYKILVLLCVAF